jgi:hypothetical protein
MCPGTFNLCVITEGILSCPIQLSFILAVLCEVSYHDLGIGRGERTAWPPRSPDLNPLEFYVWGHLNTLLYAAAVDNEKALHRRTVDSCPTIRNYSRIFERMRRSMMRRAEACTVSHGGHFEHSF